MRFGSSRRPPAGEDANAITTEECSELTHGSLVPRSGSSPRKQKETRRGRATAWPRAGSIVDCQAREPPPARMVGVGRRPAAHPQEGLDAFPEDDDAEGGRYHVVRGVAPSRLSGPFQKVVIFGKLATCPFSKGVADKPVSGEQVASTTETIKNLPSLI